MNLFLKVILLSLFFVNPTMGFGQSKGKTTLGIGSIQSSIKDSDPHSFQAMLETELMKIGKFTIIERNRLNELIKEQNLEALGIIKGSPPPGGIKGVEYLVYGSITKFGEKESGFSLGKKFSSSGAAYEFAIDLRVVNSKSGEIIFSETVESEFTSASALKIKGFESDSTGGDPRSDAQRLAAKEISAVISTGLYPIKVVTIQKNGTIILNYGKNVLSEGEYLKLFEAGEGFTDPDTGEVLGAEEVDIGYLIVTDALGKFSKATAIHKFDPEKGQTGRKLTIKEAKAAKKVAKAAQKTAKAQERARIKAEKARLKAEKRAEKKAAKEAARLAKKQRQ